MRVSNVDIWTPKCRGLSTPASVSDFGLGLVECPELVPEDHALLSGVQMLVTCGQVVNVFFQGLRDGVVDLFQGLAEQLLADQVAAILGSTAPTFTLW